MNAWWATRNEAVELLFYGDERRFWEIRERNSGKTLTIGAPQFEVNGRSVAAALTGIEGVSSGKRLSNGMIEYRLEGTIRDATHLRLAWIVRISEADNPVVRFYYELCSEGEDDRLTKSEGRDALRYTVLRLDEFERFKEIRFSEYMPKIHSYCLTERMLDKRHFENGLEVFGPIFTAGNGASQVLFAYEHGSQSPDAFVRFRLNTDCHAEVEAVKGNYYDGYPLSQDQPYRTIWLQAALVAGTEDDLASAYRSFVLHHQTLNGESRKPYVFYNTWNYQERNRNWQGKKYLDEMNLERMLKEIDAAHEMGIEVFVIDTGWYGKTGDWVPSSERFPDGLKEVKARLDGYGMKLGLWFNPTVAALTSSAFAEHEDCRLSKNGEPWPSAPIWETEESAFFCLVSRFGDAFADELIRLARELGVSYFKWDGIHQYDCDDPLHGHGTVGNSPQERSDCYAFQQVQAMVRIIDKLCEACPEAIVDFDITEEHRSVGLAFLSAGKYFLINNGPYYLDYNVPFDREQDNWNVFFYPGEARGWICRAPLNYDKWIPSILFLTHFMPDDPADNQLVSLGSIILGQNGIWGDLPAISSEGKRLFRETLDKYKQIRDDLTESNPVREGEIGGSPEVHEKINDRTGKGAVVLFANSSGTYRYVTKGKPDPRIWHTDHTIVSRDASGRAVIEARFEGPSARIVFFGAS